MSNEDLRKTSTVKTNKFKTDMIPNLNTRETILASAYLSERKRWTNLKDTLSAEVYTITAKVDKKIIAVKNESWAVQFIFKKILRKNTPAVTELSLASNKLKVLTNRLKIIIDNPPELYRYDLAVIGNTLFKPR